MKPLRLTPSPPTRLVCVLLLVAALIATADVTVLAVIAVGGLLLAVSLPSSRSAHLRFLLWIWLPLTMWLVVVWAGLVSAPPGTPVRSDRIGGLVYALQVALRLEAIAALLQSVFLSMSLEQIGASLTTLRIPRHVALTVMCALALGPEIRKRADQVLTARIARGLAGHRNKLAALKNVAGTLMPIVAWGFRSAVIRSEYWTQRNLLDSPELQRRAPIVFVDWLYVGLIAFACVLVVFR